MEIDGRDISQVSQGYFKEMIKEALEEASEEYLAEMAERNKWKNFWFHIRIFTVPLAGGFSGIILGEFLKWYFQKA